jgi:Flp pilus assembly protein TadG
MSKTPCRRWGFLRDRRGVAAVEFAIIAPIMIALLFGMIEIGEIVGADARARQVSSSLADIVSRDITIVDAEINDLDAAADALMFPYAATGLATRISSVEMTTPGQGRVLWSDARGMTAHAVGAAIAVPTTTGAVCPGASLVMAESRLDYSPPIAFVTSITSYQFSHRSVRCPRVIDPVRREPV